MQKQTSGYSGTPLAKKLGISEGTHILVIDAPEHYGHLLEPTPPNVVFEKRLSGATDIVHLFCTRKSALKKALPALRKSLRSDAALWVSWPKKTSNVPTDITGNTVRELALPLGFVDIKICAVNEIWSALKLVVRKELR